jgi:hypothetical protein
LINNATGSGTGSGTVNVYGYTAGGTPSGTLGSGNPAGTVGFIHGTVNISSPTIRGGTLSPGNSGVGTLTMTGGTMNWYPSGTYLFEHDASATSPAPIGGTSPLLKGTGPTVLDLLAVGTVAGQQFTLFLQPVDLPVALPTGAVTYTIVDYSGSTNATPIIRPAGFSGTNLTPYFIVTGTYQGLTNPNVTLVNGNEIQVTFTPIPEPTSLALVAAMGLCLGWTCRRRKKAD